MRLCAYKDTRNQASFSVFQQPRQPTVIFTIQKDLFHSKVYVNNQMLVKTYTYFLFYISSMMLHWERPHTNGKRRIFQRRVRWNEYKFIKFIKFYQTYQIYSILQKLYHVRKRTYLFCPSEKMHKREQETSLLFCPLE